MIKKFYNALILMLQTAFVAKKNSIKIKRGSNELTEIIICMNDNLRIFYEYIIPGE